MTYQLAPAVRPVATPKHLAWLKSIAGELATATIGRLDQTLPWYAGMPPARRAAIGNVAQSGIASFIQWYEDPESQPWVAADVFGQAPRELLKSVSLQEVLQVIRVVVQMVEERVVAQQPELREAVLTYSREIAFSAADVYAKAAEARGLWDARLEALVVDSIVSGESSQEIGSRVAALGWRGDGQAAVMLGANPNTLDSDAMRKLAKRSGADLLIGTQGRRLLCVIGLQESAAHPAEQIAEIALQLEQFFGAGPLILGSVVGAVSDANRSAKSALSAHNVASALSLPERPIRADDLLPERALAGDAAAKAVLIENYYEVLVGSSPELLPTLRSYLESGRSLEACSRKLFVHANTVRYRLKRIFEEIGVDPTEPRGGFLLQLALIFGAIKDLESGLKR
jgi:hypothetical protein